MRWDGMRWDGMRWDGMTQTAVTLGCTEQFPREAAMRSDEMRKDPTLKRHGTRMKGWEIVAAKHRRLARILQAKSLFRSISYKRFHFETSVPGLPRYYLYRNPSLVLQLNITPCVGSITIQQTKKPYDSPTADNSKYPLQKYSCNIWEL
jgi:hypothetical protein